MIFSSQVTLISAPEKVTTCRDPKDNRFLDLASAGAVDYLITGDQDLLVLDPFEGTCILTPAEFLARMGH